MKTIEDICKEVSEREGLEYVKVKSVVSRYLETLSRAIYNPTKYQKIWWKNLFVWNIDLYRVNTMYRKGHNRTSRSLQREVLVRFDNSKFFNNTDLHEYEYHNGTISKRGGFEEDERSRP